MGVFLNKCNVWENVKCKNTIIKVSSDNTMCDNSQPLLATVTMSESREARWSIEPFLSSLTRDTL